MENKIIYIAPEIRLVGMKAGRVICTSPDGYSTEGYGSSTRFYGESEWE